MFIAAIICVFFLLTYTIMYLHELIPRMYTIEVSEFQIQDILIAGAITFLLVYYNII